MQPKIEEKPGIYLFEWTDQQVKGEVSRVKVHSDGRVTGELLFTTSAPGYAPLLMSPAQLNFAASRTITDLVKTLSQRLPLDNGIWDTIIGQLAYHVLERARRGEPVEELWTSQDLKRPEYLLYPLLLKDLPTVIFGEKGTGKSTTSLIVSTCLILPWEDNPFGLITPTRSIRTLLLDWEADKGVVLYQLQCLQRGLDLPHFPISYRRCGLPLAEDMVQIQRHIADTKAEVLIIDSIGPAVGGELKEAAPALAFYNALRQLKVTSLLIGQTSKDKESKTKSIYGSTYFNYMARSVWEIRNVEDVGLNEVSIGLFHRWGNYSAKCKPIGFKVRYEEDKTIVMPEDPRTVAEFLETLSNRTRIRELLKQGARSAQTIADTLEIGIDNARKTLGRMKTRGEVVYLGAGQWGLKAEVDS